tara:strand:- start:258 stop:1148 length:891 start_codon:yes stop_codon:yes gene_type:complete
MTVSPPRRREAEDWAARLPDLRTQALRVAATVAMGAHGRRQPGAGDSFWQFRPYHQGDSVRAIDWRRSARGDRNFIREREWEAAESFWFWVDQSPSMHFSDGADRPAKWDRAIVLALAIATLLLRSGERLGLLLSGGPLMLGTGMRALDRMVQNLIDPQARTSLPPAMALPRHATVLGFGDTWAPLTDWDKQLGLLSGPGVRGQIVQVIDPVEERFSLRGRVRLEGMEGEAPELLRRAEDLSDAYAERFAGHCLGLETICQRRGWRYRRHATDQSPLPLLLALYRAISLDRRSAHA